MAWNDTCARLTSRYSDFIKPSHASISSSCPICGQYLWRPSSCRQRHICHPQGSGALHERSNRRLDDQNGRELTQLAGRNNNRSPSTCVRPRRFRDRVLGCTRAESCLCPRSRPESTKQRFGTVCHRFSVLECVLSCLII